MGSRVDAPRARVPKPSLPLRALSNRTVYELSNQEHREFVVPSMVGRNLPGLEHGTAEMAYYPEYQESYLGVEIVRPHLRKSVRGIPHPVRKHPRRKKWGLAVRYNPEVLYHLAPEDKVEDILREGLKPSNETKMTTSFPEMTERTHGRV